MSHYTADSMDELWINALDMIRDDGRRLESRAGGCLEKIGVSFKLKDLERNFLLNATRNLSPVYASAELLWYLSGSNDVAMLKHYATSYANYAQEDGTAYGAYGHRIASGVASTTGDVVEANLIAEAMHMLMEQPETRQCVIALWHPVDLLNAASGKKRDVPCTISWQFLVRSQKLYMKCDMRSNDVWLGMPYDVYVNTTIQRLMAGQLELGLGSYTHTVGSLHLYDTDAPKVEKMRKLGACDADESSHDCEFRLDTRHGYRGNTSFDGLDRCLSIEVASRAGTSYCAPAIDRVSQVLDDAAHLCAHHNGMECNDRLHSKLLTRAYLDFRRRKKR